MELYVLYYALENLTKFYDVDVRTANYHLEVDILW